MIIDDIRGSLLNESFSDIIGQSPAKEQLKGALISGRHVLIVGHPGVGKTTLARNVAKLLPVVERVDVVTKKKKKISGIERFVRVQGSPDLNVEDLLGDIDPVKALKFGPKSLEAFTPGKIFLADRGVLFFDEVNRAPEKLQNALLQVLSEGRATLGGYTVDFPLDFIFIGTMNPSESAAVEPLSDVFLDRFDIVHIGYPDSLSDEVLIVRTKGRKILDFPEKLLESALLFLRILRESNELDKKPSVRASIGLYERAQSQALISGRRSVCADDICAVLVSVLSHRISLKPAFKFSLSQEQFLRKKFDEFLEEHEELASGGGSLRRELEG